MSKKTKQRKNMAAMMAALRKAAKAERKQQKNAIKAIKRELAIDPATLTSSTDPATRELGWQMIGKAIDSETQRTVNKARARLAPGSGLIVKSAGNGRKYIPAISGDTSDPALRERIWRLENGIRDEG